MAGFCVNLAYLPDNTACCFSLSQAAESKFAHASTDSFVCVWIGRHDQLHCAMVFKSLAFAAIINCSAQEYCTPSTINDEGDHCEKLDGAARTTPHYLSSRREKIIKSRRRQPVGSRAGNLGL